MLKSAPPKNAPVVVWFRQDLRVCDNPALSAAAQASSVVPLFIHDSHSESLGGAAKWWLHHALGDLSDSLAKLGARLIVRRGEALDVLDDIVRQTGARAIFWHTLHEPPLAARDRRVMDALRDHGITVQPFAGQVLTDIVGLRTHSNKPFRVFTPFSRAARLTVRVEGVLTDPPQRLPPTPVELHSDDWQTWGLVPSHPDWAAGLRASWDVSEQGAHNRLKTYGARGFGRYADTRNGFEAEATSRLSPYLHWGQLSVARLWHEASACAHDDDPHMVRGVHTYQNELLWREFAFHLLHHAPDMPEHPLDSSFSAFPWRDDPRALRAWQQGKTGYPLVDAAMRDLWYSGWMPNRARMVVASFLVKHLLLDWRLGAAWFMDTLVDADLASNTASWQWVAGCGADAAPFIRIFNPVLQGQRFDPEGAYVRRHVRELAHLETRFIHCPWDAPPLVQAYRAGYPSRSIDHAYARARALEAFAGRNKA